MRVGGPPPFLLPRELAVEGRRLGVEDGDASCSGEGLGLRSGISGDFGGADNGEEFAGDKLSSLHTGDGGVWLLERDASNDVPALTATRMRRQEIKAMGKRSHIRSMTGKSQG